MEEVCSIKVTDDGKFVVQVMPPRKKEKEVKNSSLVMVEEPKTYVAEDEEALTALIAQYVSGRGKKKSNADKFAKGFKSKD